MIRVIRTTIGREKRGALGRRDAREGETGGRKKEGLSVVRDVLVLRHMESRALGLVAITMRRALEFEISRIGARSIHLRDNIFRSKYEYYIISAVDAGFSLPAPHRESSPVLLSLASLYKSFAPVCSNRCHLHLTFSFFSSFTLPKRMPAL